MSEIQTKTLPLSTEDIMAFFENPETFFLIDYKNSALKGESFLTYVANMKLKCDLETYTDISFEERKALLKHYMDFSYIAEVTSLQIALVSVLFYSKKKELFFDYFNQEEMEIFIEENKEKIKIITQFFDSMLLLVPSVSLDFKEHILQPMIDSGEIETIDNHDIIGINTYGLIAFPDFIDFFIGFSQEHSEMKYFKFQIENLSYKGKKFYELIKDLSSPSILMSIYNMFSSTDSEAVSYFEKIKKDAA